MLSRRACRAVPAGEALIRFSSGVWVVAAKYNLPLTSTEFSSKDYYVNIRKSLVSGISASMSASVWGGRGERKEGKH
jgi:hypothetical protein